MERRKRLLPTLAAGLTALGVALGGMMIGSGAANADGTSERDRTGTIYIVNQSGHVQTHNFKGYRLAYLSNVQGQQIAEGEYSGTVTLKPNFGINTTETYSDAVKAALKDVKATPTQTLYDQYNDKGNKDADPMSWIASKVPNDAKDYPWGKGGDDGFAADGTPNEAVMRKLANALATQLGKLSPAVGDDYKTDFKSGPQKTDKDGKNIPGAVNKVKAGLWLLVDDSGEINGELGSGAMLVSSTYDDVPYESRTDGNGGQDGTPATKTTSVERLNDSPLGRVTVKNSRPAVAKEVVKETSDSTPDKRKYTSQDKPTYNIGDTVTYKLYTRIPTFNGYPYDPTLANKQTTRQLHVYDFASRMLTVDQADAVESVRLVPAGVDSDSDDPRIVTLDPGTDYTVKVEPLGDQHRDDGPTCNDESERKDPSQGCDPKHPNRYQTAYDNGAKTTVDLAKYLNFAEGSTSAKTGKVLEGYNVEIVFKARLNKNANVSTRDHVVANPNYIRMDFSNNAGDCSQTGDDWGGEVNVYTFKFQIKKTSRTGAVLDGAKFVVKDVQKNLYLGDLNKDDEWTYAKYKTTDGRPTGDTTSPVAHVFTSDRNGMITGLTGLASGTYEVEEIEPPAGYTHLDLPKFNVTINATYQQDKGTAGQTFGFSTGKTSDDDLKWGDYYVGAQSLPDSDDNTIVDDEGTPIGTITFRVGIDAERNTGSTGTVSIPSTGDYRLSIDKGDATQVDVINAKDISQLPLTGGMGLMLFGLVAAFILGGAAFMIAKARRTFAAGHASRR